MKQVIHEARSSQKARRQRGLRITNAPAFRVAILTGGGDKHYSVGLALALVSDRIQIDFIGSDHLASPLLESEARVNFLNLRGNQRENAGAIEKISRVLAYYVRLIRYTATSEAAVFHILWNNRFEAIDRTVLTLYYKLCGKRVVLTAHNVNAGKRDLNDTWWNRFTLRVQYDLVDHIFVHTAKSRDELQCDFGIPSMKISVVPYGINNTVPNTAISTADARRKLGLLDGNRTLLFFGQIAPYKGLHDLISACIELTRRWPDLRLIIAGKPKWSGDYWKEVQKAISDSEMERFIVWRIGFVPDDEIEIYFKAADALVLPYTDIFQSGVLFLGYSFGLPVIVADVGSLKDEIVLGKTGFVCRPFDASDLAKTIDEYFASDLFRDLENRRADIREYAKERYSWSKLASITTSVYAHLLAS